LASEAASVGGHAGRAAFIAIAYRTINLIFRTFLGLLVLIARYPYLLVGPLRIPAPAHEQVEVPAGALPVRPRTRQRAVRLPRRHPGKIHGETPVPEVTHRLPG